MIQILLATALLTQDTSLTVQGMLLQVAAVTGAEWVIALPTPLRVRDRRVTEFSIAGDIRRWEKLQNHYVEARGSVTERSMRVDAMREVEPEGTARKLARTSFSNRVQLVLWVLPQHFRWRDSAGRTSGVTPTIIYTMTNHGESPLTLTFERNEFVCFAVEPIDNKIPTWHFETRLPLAHEEHRSITLSNLVREVTAIPFDAAPLPGRYRVRAGLCGFNDYQLETEIEVLQ